MRGTVKVKGPLEDRVRTLLGGQNPTTKRVLELLDELDQRRAVPGQEILVPSQSGPTDTMASMPARPEASDDTEPALVAMGHFTTTARRGSLPTDLSEASAAAEPPAGWAEERRVLYATLKGLEAKIEELRKPPTAEERDQAIGAGKLPPPGIAAPVLGTPTTSPLGPPVFYKVCECGQCTPFRKFHWWCVICRSGPHPYQGRYPHFTKTWLGAGGVSGVAHHCCSESCRLHYLGLIGVAPGVNDMEPPPAPVTAGVAPERPHPAYDSD